MFDFFLSLVQVLITFLAAKTLGNILLRRWVEIPQQGLRIVFESGLGLLLISYALFCLVQLHLLEPAVLWLLFVILAGLAVAGLHAGRRQGLIQSAKKLPMPLFCFVALWIGWVLMNAIVPPLGIDELVYHLAVPQDLLESGGQVLFTDNVYAYFPQLVDMFFVWGLGLGGELAARLFHSLYAILTGAAIYSFARGYLSEKYSYLAALLFLTIPTVLIIAPWAYVDISFAFYSFLAFVSLLKYIESSDKGWIYLTGLMAGAAWAAKYTGMQFTMLLLLILLIHRLRTSDKSLPLDAVVFPLIAFLTVSPYLIRNWLITGWPLFPFNVGLFGLRPEINWDPERSALFLQWLGQYGAMGEGTLIDKLLAPVLVFLTARLGDAAAYDGMIGFAFLLIPVLFLKPDRRPRNFWIFGLFALSFLYYWAFTTQQVRFLFPVLPVLAFLLAYGLEKLGSQILNSVVLGCILLSIFFAVNFQLKFRPQEFWFGVQSRDAFLSERVAGAPVYQQANSLDSEDTLFLVNMSNLNYLLEVAWRSDFVFEYYRLGRELENAASPAELEPFFREMGITHMMINEGVTLSPGALADRERRLLRDFLESRTEVIFHSPIHSGYVLRRLMF